MADYALSNRIDASYMLTTLVPILATEPAYNQPSFQTRIRRFLAELPTGDASPFLRIPTLHFCRFVVIYDLPCQGYPVATDHLNSPYLLMAATMTGDWRSCMETMLAEIPQVFQAIYSNCVGYPGVNETQSFIDYLAKCQIDAAFSFGAYPQASLYEVKRALDVQAQFRRFVLDTQTTEPQDLQQRFQQFMSQVYLK